MKNIFELLSDSGVTLEGDSKDKFEKAFLENYKTVAEVNNLSKKIETYEQNEKSYKDSLSKKDSDLAELQKKLEEAGTDGSKLAELQTELANMKTAREQEKAEFDKKLKAQKYEHLVREKAGELKFSSVSAKKAFIADALGADLKMKDGDLLGFNDYVELYKKEDSAAFIVDTPPAGGTTQETPPAPQFSTKSAGASQETPPAETPLIF